MSSNQTSKILRERRFVEFFVRYVWNFYRLFVVGRQIAQRCVQCSASEHLYALDEQNVCEKCRTSASYVKPTSIDSQTQKDMESSLDALLSGASGKGKWKYDALVFFSGGKDSTYLLHKLKTDYPSLRMLAISVDNSFMSPIAVENIERVIKKLNIDHVFVRPRADLYEKMFRYAFTHPSAKGAAEAIDVLDGEFRFDIGRHIAAQWNIPLIIIGFSRMQVATYMSSPQFEADRVFEESKRMKASMYNIADLPLSKEESEYWWDGTQYEKEQIARIIYPLVVWNFSEEYLMEQVTALGLVEKNSVSPAVTNHLLIPLMAFADFSLLGYSSWEPEFSQMIREGKADRVYWRNMFELIEYAAKTGRFVGRSVDEMLKRLNLKPQDIGLPLR